MFFQAHTKKDKIMNEGFVLQALLVAVSRKAFPLFNLSCCYASPLHVGLAIPHAWNKSYKSGKNIIF